MLITSGFLSKKRAKTRAIVVKTPIAIETPVAKRKALFFRDEYIVVPYLATNNRFSICNQDILFPCYF